MARDTDDFDREDWEPEPEPDPRAAARRVKPPAVALVVVGVLSLGYIGWGVYGYFFTMRQEFAAEREKVLTNPAYDEAAQRQMLDILSLTEQFTLVAYPVSWGLQAVFALLMIGGGVPMFRLQSRGWGMAAAAVAVVPHLECFVWLASTTVGIWALIVLNNRDVKRAFAANK